MGEPIKTISRRRVIGIGLSGAVLAATGASIPALAAWKRNDVSAANANGEHGDDGIEGGWYVTIHVTTPNVPPPIDFDALYSFASGGVFTRIDGRTNAPGLGTWKHSSDGIVFSAVLFNFSPGVVPTFATRKGAVLGNFAARVVDGTLTGTFTADGMLGHRFSSGWHLHWHADRSGRTMKRGLNDSGSST